MSDDLWLKTKEASDWLGFAACTLKRKRDIKGGFLKNGIHWVSGATYNSPMIWNVERCRAEFNRMGIIQKQHSSLRRRNLLAKQQKPLNMDLTDRSINALNVEAQND